MDKLKEYLLRHKADLDVDSPAGDTWDHIAPGLRSGAPRRTVWYAAAACVIALTGLGLWLVVKDRKTPADSAKYNQPATVKEPAPGKEKPEDSLRKQGSMPERDIVRNTPPSKRPVHKAGTRKP